MARVATRDVVVKATSTTVTAFNTAVTLTGNDAKLMLDAMKRLQTIVDITGVGVARRQRRDAGLDDLASVSISGLLDTSDTDGLWALLKGSRANRASFLLTVEYGDAANAIAANWLVGELESDHVVADFVMAKATLEAEGGGYADTV